MKPARRESPAPIPQIFRDIDTLVTEAQSDMRRTLSGALRIGMRLAKIHQDPGDTDGPGSLKAVLAHIESRVPLSTAYRWMNAAGKILADHAGDSATMPALPEPGTAAWNKLEMHLIAACEGLSIRRILLGSVAPSDDARLDTLITASENAEPGADEILERVSRGELTLVQAIRAQAGAKATRGKERHDPVYLDIDSETGQLAGLYPKCMITLANTFSRWESLDESARNLARKSWKELVAHLPKDLR